jgi:hypothetical protein
MGRYLGNIATGHSFLEPMIRKYLKNGCALYYRGMAFDTEPQARRFKAKRLKEYVYDWNIQS